MIHESPSKLEKAAMSFLLEMGITFCNTEHEVDLFNEGFSRGAEWQKQQDDWIEITPDILLTLRLNKPYHVCNRHSESQYIASLATDSEWYTSVFSGKKLCGITHYRELPLPPKEK